MTEVEARVRRMLKDAKALDAKLVGKPRAATQRLHLNLRILVLEEALGLPSPFVAESPTIAEANADRVDAWRERKGAEGNDE